MQAKDIEAYLADLGSELQRMGMKQPIRLLLIGGAFMLIQLYNRPATKDVDVLLKDVDDPATSPLYQNFKTAVRTIANRNRIPPTWINDMIGDFLRDATRVPPGRLWRVYGLLELYIPEVEYILALKLLAGRQKDRVDIQILCSQAQDIVDQYIPDKQVQQLNNLDDTLNTLFP